MEFQEFPLWRKGLIIASCIFIMISAITMPIGFILHWMGKEEQSRKFIKYGAFCGATGFALGLLSVPGFFWEAVIIIVGIQIFTTYLKRSKEKKGI